MNNKKGGVGGIILLVVILMIASAIAGAYGYRVLDGKMAAKEAMQAVEKVDISDYDSAEQTIIQGYIDDTTKKLENAQTRKQVYEIISEFISDVDKVQTSKEKELAKALQEAEDAKKKLEEQQNQNNNNNGSGSNGGLFGGSNNNNSNNANSDSGKNSSSDSTGSGSGSSSSDDSGSGYKSNNLTGGETETGNSGSNGFLDSLLGGLASGSGN